LRAEATRSVAVLAATAVALAGCGGDDTDDVSAEELISRGDELCREGQQRFEQIQGDTPANAAEALEQTEALVQVADEELDELSRMRPPEELRDAYDRYLDARADGLELLERGRDAAEDGDAEAYAEAQTKLAAEQGTRVELAREIGFSACSRPDR
jgi:ElaB/YqjD/DUF883 family membrane-anchored ribosome-binding protein